MAKVAVITVSDSCARGEREDLSGPAVAARLSELGFEIVARVLVADDEAAIRSALISAAEAASLVVTTGGTGIAARDVTPEATRAVCQRVLDGLSEQMRAVGNTKTPFAALSRAVCGTRGTSLIINLPGSPKGALESLDAVAELIPHAIDLLAGKTAHTSTPAVPKS